MKEYKPDHLIVRYLSNEATAEEQEQLFEWVSESRNNQKVFNKYIELWSSHASGDNLFNVDTGLRKLHAKIDAYEAGEKPKTIFWNKWSLAAAIILLITCGFVLFLTGNYSLKEHLESPLTEYKAPSSGLSSRTLRDGSIITLNANASIQYPESFVGSTREVYLTGEAFFEIAKDSLRPFIVHTGDITTRVLGTSFNIHSERNKVVVTVATGKVSVSDDTRTEVLVPYEKITYSKKAFEKARTDLTELAWYDRTLIFNDTRLDKAAVMLTKHFGVTVSFDNEAVKKCLITGKFKNQSLETILQAIEYSIDVSHKKEDGTIVFYGKGCQ